MHHKETCFCKTHTLDFHSDFGADVVDGLYCPKCSDRAPKDAVMFELCEPGELAGIWGVRYNTAELTRLDPHFSDSENYFLGLLIGFKAAPDVVRSYYRDGGLCRVIGVKGEYVP